MNLPSNRRSSTFGLVGTLLPAGGAGLGIASIAGVTGCHLEVFILPIGLMFLGCFGAMLLGAFSWRQARSKRGRILPVLAVATGLVGLGLLALIAKDFL